MTDTQKKTLEDLAPWINRILLGIVAFFLIQTNSKFNEVITKLDVVIVTQATYRSEINEIKNYQNKLHDDIEDCQDDIKKFNQDISKFYENYGYLFSESTRRKLE